MAVLSGLLEVVTYVVSGIANAGSVQATLQALGGSEPVPRSTLSEAFGWRVALLVGLLLRSGDLVLESSGEQGGLRLVDVPRVEAVQRTITELMDDNDRRRRLGSDDTFDDPFEEPDDLFED